MKHSKIAIIGAGKVGASCAYALILKNVAAEILLVDVNKDVCEGEVLDLSDAVPFSETSQVTQGSLQSSGQADIIVITAGAAQKPGQTRLDLVDTNKKILDSIIGGMKPINKDAIILLVANPVDILTMIAQELSGLTGKQVIGSGTLLDTQRLRGLVSKELKIAQQSVHAYVLGEHGNSQFVAWSHANIVGTPLSEYVSQEQMDVFAHKAMRGAYEIIEKKGATYYGVAACVAEICECILFDQKRILPVSSYHDNLGVALSLPTVIGRGGVENVFDIQLSREEQEKLEGSIKALKDTL